MISPYNKLPHACATTWHGLRKRCLLRPWARRYIAMKIFPLALLLLSSALQGAETNWKNAEEALMAYANNPSSENAVKATNSLPTEHAPWGEDSPARMAASYIYHGDQFSMLRYQVGVGHDESVQLAFRLFSISDGAFTEDLQIAIGNIIRSFPELFLRELKNSSLTSSHYDGILLNDDYAFVDRFQAKCLEIESRISSLKSVSASDLIQIRDYSIRIVEEAEKNYC